MGSSDIESCGLPCWTPKWIQRLATPAAFLFSTCMITFSDALFGGVLAGIGTSLETRYKMSTTQIGFLFTAYSIGLVVVLPFVAYYGGHPSRNRPRWMAWGNIISVIGTIIFILPQFIYGPFKKEVSISEEKLVSFCRNNGLINDTFITTCLENNDQVNLARSDKVAYFLLTLGILLLGIGFAPMRPLSSSYIDDNSPKKAGLFFGIIDSMYGIATIIGLLLTVIFLEIWVDFYRADTTELKPGDPAWVGAWWVAVAVSGVSFLISAMPFFCLPKQMPRSSKVMFKTTRHEDLSLTSPAEDDTTKCRTLVNETKLPTSILDLFQAVCRLLRNPAFVALCLASIFEALMSGSHSLFPKYFEEQFRLPPAEANLIIAIGPVCGIFVGSILGGYLINRFNLDAIGASKLAFATSMIGAVLGIAMMLTGCKQPDFAGLTSANDMNNSSSTLLLSSCNVNCGCSTDAFVPVCGDDKLTYFSPCHAGCSHAFNETVYTNCACASSNAEDYRERDNGFISPSAYVGACATSCKAVIPFAIFLVMFAVAMSMFPISRLLITIRCVDPVDKSFSIGVSRFLTYIFGTIPSTIAIGAIIDTACTVWQIDKCGQRGQCWIYDITKYRHYYMGFNVGLAFLTSLCYALTWYFLQRRLNKVQKEHEKELERVNSKMET